MAATSPPVLRRLSPRQRQRLVRGVLYVLFVVGVAAFAVVADWTRIRTSFFNVDLAREMFPLIITRAAKNTIVYTILAFLIGLTGGVALALMKLSPVAPYRWLATGYIEFFRGLPAILTLFLFGFGVPIAFPGFRWPGGNIGGAIVGLGAVAAAYMAETLRAGIEAVPKGQTEAARSLGMSSSRTLVSIVLPQAFRIVIPPLTNEVVLLIKDTALFFVIGFQLTQKELFRFSQDIANDNFNATPLIVGGFMYLAVTLPMTRLVAQLEKRNKAAR